MREKFEYYYVLDPVLGSRPTFSIPYSTGDLDEGALDLNRSEFNETLNDEVSDDKNEGFIPFTSNSSSDINSNISFSIDTNLIVNTNIDSNFNTGCNCSTIIG